MPICVQAGLDRTVTGMQDPLQWIHKLQEGSALCGVPGYQIGQRLARLGSSRAHLLLQICQDPVLKALKICHGSAAVLGTV